MKVLLCFVVIMLDVARGDMAGECDVAFFYLELGCTPVASDNSTSCPQAFTCPDLHPDPTMCYYRGVPYAANAMVPQNLVKNPCSQRCTCQVYGAPQFECAAVDCVETFDKDLQQCVNVYEVDSCCSVGNVCGKDAIAKLKTCEVDGKIYREGEVFEPKNTMKTCICTAQWNGDIDCGIEIHYQNNILNNCAPMFFKNTRSCPISFKCPSSETKVVRGLNTRAVSSKCVFGNDTLAVGDEVIVEEKCTKCSCEVPPFVSCTQQNTCS
ncbi:hypothetical protein MSG28_007935 [Choristoneura fumiferana]|uniref:Uncharacterized protein n=1 Tax=Choristoneura fumiferana TaxID=7141 RepID=A0ACC0J9E1_CHOFU|nr:hypothetical protein MSG28_007935 [Choristoneura fumiferana]